MQTNYEKELEAAKEIALKAGALVKKMSSEDFEIRKKGQVDLVTEADLASEKLIISELNRRFPDHDILAEESAKEFHKAPNLWVVDPVDGTTNYAHRFPIYSVSIALVCENEPVVGVVYDPNMGELFAARKNGEATLNDKPISISSIEVLDKALLATGFPYDLRQNPHPTLDRFFDFTMKAQGVRRAGVASLDMCNLACGRYDGFWEVGLKPWDMAAASLILEKAGGRLSKFDDSEFDIWTPEILATNGLIHDEMVAGLAEK